MRALQQICLGSARYIAHLGNFIVISLRIGDYLDISEFVLSSAIIILSALRLDQVPVERVKISCRIYEVPLFYHSFLATYVSSLHKGLHDVVFS